MNLDSNLMVQRDSITSWRTWKPALSQITWIVLYRRRRSSKCLRNKRLSHPCFDGGLGHEHLPAPPVDRLGEVLLPVCPLSLDLRLLPLGHPHPAALGVGVDLDLVLPDRRLVGGQLFQELAQFGQFAPSLLLVRRGGERGGVSG